MTVDVLSCFLVSSRGHPLVLGSRPIRPTLTIELYTKWYGLFLVTPTLGGSGWSDLKAVEIPFPENYHLGADKTGHLVMEPLVGELAFVDHVPNPKVVQAFAKASGYEIDELAFEMMVGRWAIEVENRT